MIRTERPRGVTLRMLDFSALLAQAPHGDGETVSTGYAPWAATEHDGALYVVCNEGVGWEVTDDDPLEVDLYVSTPGHIAILPRYRTTLSPDEVRAAMTAEPVDLADLVRTFGARLEDNFHVWHRTLTR